MDSRLNHVIAVARSGSFTGAADIVGITQSAVTRSVADLERQIGFAIFVRTPRGALLTEPGRDFVERAQRIVEDASELLQWPGSDADGFAGVLRIGVCPASLEFTLVEPLKRLLKRHRGIRLDVNGSTFERVVQLLRNGAIDIAVGFEAAFADWPDLRRQPLPSLDSVVLFVRKDHPILQLDPMTLDALAEFEFVSPSDSRPYGALIRALYEDRRIDCRRRIHLIDYFPLVRAVVTSTDAIGVVARHYAAAASFRRDFHILPDLGLFPEPYPMCYAVRARWEIRPAVRALISVMQLTDKSVWGRKGAGAHSAEQVKEDASFMSPERYFGQAGYSQAGRVLPGSP